MLRLSPFLTVDFLEVSLSTIWGLLVKKEHVRLEFSILMEISLDYHKKVIRGDKKILLDTDCPSSAATSYFSFLILRIWQSYLEGNTKICTKLQHPRKVLCVTDELPLPAKKLNYCKWKRRLLACCTVHKIQKIFKMLLIAT